MILCKKQESGFLSKRKTSALKDSSLGDSDSVDFRGSLEMTAMWVNKSGKVHISSNVESH